MSNQHSNIPVDQIGSERRQSIDLTVGKTILDGDILPFDIASFGQSTVKCWDKLLEQSVAGWVA